MKNAPTATNSQSTKNNQLEQSQYTTESLKDLSTAAQRARVLHHLQNHRALTTLEARHLLNVMHPAARVMELRKRGFKIITNWRDDNDTAGRLHRVAEYVLMPGGDV